MSDTRPRYVRASLEALPFPADESAPSRFLAMPWGEVALRDASLREAFDEPGSLVVNDRSAAEIPRHFGEADIKPHVNADHSMYGEAYGWIDGVEVVAGEGIYITAEWTDLGEAALKGRRYRYSSLEAVLDASPWYLDGSPAVVVAVTGCALTNHPAVIGQKPVAYSTLTEAIAGQTSANDQPVSEPPAKPGRREDAQMDGNFFESLISRLNRGKPKDEAEAACSVVEIEAKLAKIDGLTARVDELTTQLSAITQERDGLQAKLAEIQAAETKAKAEAAVQAALDSGRLTPAMREKALEMATASLENFTALTELTPEGHFAAPTDKQVPDDVRASADTATMTGGDRAALHAEIIAVQRDKGLSYTEAHAAVLAEHRSAGKGN